MKVRKPGSWKGFRGFLKEYVIIVVGVLTALAAEQAAQIVNWRMDVSDAREALRGEIAYQGRYFRERVEIAPCVDRHLARYRDLIDRTAKAGRTPGDPAPLIRIGRRIDTGEWEAANAAEVLVHFPDAERTSLSILYRQTQDLMTWRDEEGTIFDALAVLDGPSKVLAPATVDQLRIALLRAQHLQELWKLNAQRQLDRMGRMGISPQPADPEFVAEACSLGAGTLAPA